MSLRDKAAGECRALQNGKVRECTRHGDIDLRAFFVYKDTAKVAIHGSGMC